jgi:hypothetical protein
MTNPTEERVKREQRVARYMLQEFPEMGSTVAAQYAKAILAAADAPAPAQEG